MKVINPSELNLSALPSMPLENRLSLPQSSGIYFAIDSQNTIQYIGRAVNINQRWTQHHRYYQLSQMGSVRIAYLTADADLLPSIESALIQWFNPALNGSDVKVGSNGKIRVSLYLDPKIKIDLERLAKTRKRPLSNLMEVLCEEIVASAKESGELSND